jgi:hypothetical protein
MMARPVQVSGQIQGRCQNPVDFRIKYLNKKSYAHTRAPVLLPASRNFLTAKSKSLFNIVKTPWLVAKSRSDFALPLLRAQGIAAESPQDLH